MKKISVIVPIHNCENNLDYSIKSIIDQTYKNLEILLVENASTDKSIEICDEYGKKHSNIKVFHLDIPDLSNARNVGLDNATGEYISFIDGDDFLYKTFYEDLVSALENMKADIAECKIIRIPYGDNYEEKIKEANKKNIESHCLTNIEALSKYYSSDVDEYVNKVMVSNKIYKKELYEKMRFPFGRIHEDEATTYKVLYNINKLAETSKALYGYVQNSNSIMNKSFNVRRITDAYKAFEEAINFFEANKEPYLEAEAKLRYLEYCLEFSYKVENSDLENKIEYKNKLYKMFRENFKWITFIKQQINGKDRRIAELERLYNNDIKNLDEGWMKL